MDRKSFIQQTISGMISITGLSSFRQFTGGLEQQERPMPVFFIGHGSPMNGIEDNIYSQNWKKIAQGIPVPKAVLVVSAHWLTKGTRVTAMDRPRTIHDFGGFPQALFDVQYPAPGSPEIARETIDTVKTTPIVADHEWGLDHGAWTIIRHMYPDANIPVLQLSIDYGKDASYHYSLAAELMTLRKKGVLIIGSGNMVHNLGMVAWDKLGQPGFGFDWAIHMNDLFKKHITNGNDDALIRYEQLGREARLAIPTPDHYFPLIYSLGLRKKEEEIQFFNDQAVGGSLTMTSVRFG